jgi:ribonucleoside-diphosphate reductase alpha chain
MLQLDGTAYDSIRARILNGYIFGELRKRSDEATAALAKEYGEPLWCKGHGRRNTHCLAIAPTVSNAVISGQVSPGLEPIVANIFAHKTAKGTFIVKNTQLEKVLEAAGENTDKVWLSINANGGSVQHLKFLDEKTKEIFLTAREMNQLVLIKQAADRQKWVDQGQSLNIFVPPNVDPKYFHQIHWQAWELGLKSLYYCRSGSVLKSDLASREHERKLIAPKEDDDCKECGG